jgi:hypothetical protein
LKLQVAELRGEVRAAREQPSHSAGLIGPDGSTRLKRANGHVA